MGHSFMTDIPFGISVGRYRTGQAIVWAAFFLMLVALAVQILHVTGRLGFGFDTWRPVLYAYAIWGVALSAGQVIMRGDDGWRALFILPAALFTVAVVLFPTVFAIAAAFTDWNLSSAAPPRFNGLDNFRRMMSDPYFWNALFNMGFYLLAVVVQYALAFGLALLLNAEIRARKFFRVAFLLPFMLSPVAVSWMIGKSMMDFRTGPISDLMRLLGWSEPSFFTSPWIARISVATLDAWVWIPFSVILLLAGLQAIPRDLREASKIDGASGWQNFWEITFPLMMPVSITALLVRIIFQLKLADIVINTTYGGPGGATDTISSFIFREYRDRANVGYGTMMAMFYLVCIVIFLLLFLKFAEKLTHRTQGDA
ncbi:sugar ABC transporter permease (plasmid) [Paracoccus versutus]|nr:sugar ABC transporter permease [Paracoccus versutus]